ncbi:patr class I histocompatibility antigen, B-2 alpha chain-like [Crotalus tigris]|uniref:patr class I histocompatibility antigen, B-2 alpha chain-like n=1 Tax=Crotalus tigris TaxID=88082 RepID=UPI00192F471D|nr:patr class I histocompatibility antigen, B-2 alpha chain-like [Crotalus tigris]
MALRSLSLLVWVAVALRESCQGASSHSMKYFYSFISEPSQGLPQFVSVGYVDGQVFAYYDSNSQREQPRVSWMEEVGKDDPQYWDRNTQISRGTEEAFRRNLETLRRRYNQNESFHIIQWMYGCELYADGRKGGFDHYGYDGRTFITFDKERLTWVALQPEAQITQRKVDAIPGLNQRKKAYLEEECIEWLEKHLSYGKETLLRTEIPVVTMSSRTELDDGMQIRVCRLDGFYPREIEASWTRDGEVWLQDTFRGSVAPNADGTFHAWLSIQIDPKERGRYRCHVEHDSLQEPLDVVLKDPPMVTVNRTVVENGMEIHVCHMDGFYPKKIDASWRRDGEVWQNDTLHGSVASNADGTFYTWLSIRIDPEERGRYRCHVEHDGLQEPLDVAIKEPKSNLGLIFVYIVTVLVLLGVIVVGIWFFRRIRG